MISNIALSLGKHHFTLVGTFERLAGTFVIIKLCSMHQEWEVGLK